MTKKNLVIVRAGDSSLHPGWLEGEGDRNWDIVVNYFGNDPDKYRAPDVVRIDSKGPKWPALHDLIAANPQFISDYEYIWLPDDDLRATKQDINRLFKLCAEYKLEAAQPALTWDSYYSYVKTLQNKNMALRFTNFVEIMAPCLSSSMLRKALPIFNATLSGWGMDFIWPKLAENSQTGIAIIDAVTVCHTRPIGGPNYAHMKEKGIAPHEEGRVFCRTYGLGERPANSCHGAILADGKMIDALANPRWFALRYISGYARAVGHVREPRIMWRHMANVLAHALIGESAF